MLARITVPARREDSMAPPTAFTQKPIPGLKQNAVSFFASLLLIFPPPSNALVAVATVGYPPNNPRSKAGKASADSPKRNFIGTEIIFLKRSGNSPEPRSPDAAVKPKSEGIITSAQLFSPADTPRAKTAGRAAIVAKRIKPVRVSIYPFFFMFSISPPFILCTAGSFYRLLLIFFV